MRPESASIELGDPQPSCTRKRFLPTRIRGLEEAAKGVRAHVVTEGRRRQDIRAIFGPATLIQLGAGVLIISTKNDVARPRGEDTLRLRLENNLERAPHAELVPFALRLGSAFTQVIAPAAQVAVVARRKSRELSARVRWVGHTAETRAVCTRPIFRVVICRGARRKDRSSLGASSSRCRQSTIVVGRQTHSRLAHAVTPERGCTKRGLTPFLYVSTAR